MNLLQFLKEIDKIMIEMPREDLEKFIYELAKILPESEREHFLNTMQTANSKNSQNTLIQDSCLEALALEINELTTILKSINEGDRYLESEYNAEWDDWYNSDAEEVLFSDPQRLLTDIEKGIRLVHKCLDMEAYHLGCRLAELLSTISISAEGDYNDFDGSPMGINELYSHSLLNGSLKKFTLELLYLTYMESKLSDRPEKLFSLMNNYDCTIFIRDIMQIGNQELPDFDEFLPLWLKYLSKQSGWRVQDLFQEAMSLLEDDNILLENARKFVDTYPESYKHLLEKGSENFDNEKMFQIGKEALDKIPDNYMIRSEIALLTAEYACRMNDRDASEVCWLEAFRSNTNVVNYMRIRFMAKNWQNYQKQIMQILSEMVERRKRRSEEQTEYYNRNVQRENTLDSNTYFAILFFNKDFENLIREETNKESISNWSSFFCEKAPALFLLLLFKGEKLPEGLNYMAEKAVSTCDFTTETYLKGTGIYLDKNNHELFWDLFCKWKEEVNLPETTSINALEYMEQFIRNKVTRVMDSKYRNAYGSCAAFIAALGEVKESWGIHNAKADIMKSYKNEYPRRKVFQQGLRDYGMQVH